MLRKLLERWGELGFCLGLTLLLSSAPQGMLSLARN